MSRNHSYARDLSRYRSPRIKDGLTSNMDKDTGVVGPHSEARKCGSPDQQNKRDSLMKISSKNADVTIMGLWLGSMPSVSGIFSAMISFG